MFKRFSNFYLVFWSFIDRFCYFLLLAISTKNTIIHNIYWKYKLNAIMHVSNISLLISSTSQFFIITNEEETHQNEQAFNRQSMTGQGWEEVSMHRSIHGVRAVVHFHSDSEYCWNNPPPGVRPWQPLGRNQKFKPNSFVWLCLWRVLNWSLSDRWDV